MKRWTKTEEDILSEEFALENERKVPSTKELDKVCRQIIIRR